MWTYTETSTIQATVPSGGSATTISFSLTNGGTPSKPLTRSGTISLTGNCNGVIATYNITLTAEGDF